MRLRRALTSNKLSRLPIIQSVQRITQMVSFNNTQLQTSLLTKEGHTRRVYGAQLLDVLLVMVFTEIFCFLQGLATPHV